MPRAALDAISSGAFWIIIFLGLSVIFAAYFLAKHGAKGVSRENARAYGGSSFRTPLNLSLSIIGLLLPGSLLGLAGLDIPLDDLAASLITGVGVVLGVALLLAVFLTFGLVRYSQGDDKIEFHTSEDVTTYTGGMLSVQLLLVLAVLSMSLLGVHLMTLRADHAPPITASAASVSVAIMRLQPQVGAHRNAVRALWGEPDSIAADGAFFYRGVDLQYLLQFREDSLHLFQIRRAGP